MPLPGGGVRFASSTSTGEHRENMSQYFSVSHFSVWSVSAAEMKEMSLGSLTIS